MITIYPNPGSFNDFCARNPEISATPEAIICYSTEVSMWRATHGVDAETQMTLTPGESAYRLSIQRMGAPIVELAQWPTVGEYTVPVILASQPD